MQLGVANQQRAGGLAGARPLKTSCQCGSAGDECALEGAKPVQRHLRVPLWFLWLHVTFWRGSGWSITVPTPCLLLLPSPRSRASLAPGREHTAAKGVQHCWPSYSSTHSQHQPGWWGAKDG